MPTDSHVSPADTPIDSAALTVLRELRTLESFVYVTGEVGIGASITSNGALMSGRHGWASELGHVCVDPLGEVCGCGATGCLETIAGLDRVLARLDAASLDDLIERLTSADAAAVAVMDDVARALGRALSAALNLLDIPAIVLGYLGACEQWLVPTLRDELGVRVLWAPYQDIEILSVAESPRRPAQGAALAALGAVMSDPIAWLESSGRPA